jgi:hypothetical protein
MHFDIDDLNRFPRRLDDIHPAKVDAHLSDCPTCGDELSDEARLGAGLMACDRALSSDAPEKRLESRIPSDAAAQLQIFSPFCPDRFPARVLDVSKHSLRIAFGQLLQPGTVVQLHVKQLYILGEVRCCAASESGDRAFLIGVEIQDVCEW